MFFFFVLFFSSFIEQHSTLVVVVIIHLNGCDHIKSLTLSLSLSLFFSLFFRVGGSLGGFLRFLVAVVGAGGLGSKEGLQEIIEEPTEARRLRSLIEIHQSNLIQILNTKKKKDEKKR